MAGAPTITAGTQVDSATAVTSIVVPKANFGTVVDGDVLGVALRSQGTVPLTQEISFDTGWARTTETNGSGDRGLGIFFLPVPVASAEARTSFTFGNFSSGRVIAEPFVLHGVDLTNIIGGGDGYEINNPPAVTGEDTPYLALALWGDERTSGNSMVPTSTPSGWTQVYNGQTGGAGAGTTGSRTAIWLGSKSEPEGGSINVASPTLVWASASSQRSTIAIFNGTKVAAITGEEFTDGLGNKVLISYKDAAGNKVNPTLIKAWYPGFASVTDALAHQAGATSAHRGGSLAWPEMSEYAYDHSVLYGHSLLEFSCGWNTESATGGPGGGPLYSAFGLGDQYLDRVAGVTGSVDPLTMTRAAMKATYQNKLRPVSSGVYQPFFALEDFLDKYTPTHVVLVDPKFGIQSAAILDQFMDILDAHGGPTKIIVKFDSPTPGTYLNTIAHARGYKTMNYWGGIANSAAMAAQQSNWDIIGALYSDAAMMAQANTYGKPVWGAVVPDQAGYATALANGADIIMISDPKNIKPVSAWN